MIKSSKFRNDINDIFDIGNTYDNKGLLSIDIVKYKKYDFNFEYKTLQNFIINIHIDDDIISKISLFYNLDYLDINYDYDKLYYNLYGKKIDLCNDFLNIVDSFLLKNCLIFRRTYNINKII